MFLPEREARCPEPGIPGSTAKPRNQKLPNTQIGKVVCKLCANEKTESRAKSAQLSDYQRSGKRDSNSRPSAWEADALPTELFPRSCFCTQMSAAHSQCAGAKLRKKRPATNLPGDFLMRNPVRPFRAEYAQIREYSCGLSRAKSRS